jgi:hypothetical protein
MQSSTIEFGILAQNSHPFSIEVGKARAPRAGLGATDAKSGTVASAGDLIAR